MNNARRRPVGGDVDTAVRDGQSGQLLLHRAARAVDVQHRNDDRFSVRRFPDERDGLRERIPLDTDEDDVRSGCALRALRLKRGHVRRLDRNGPRLAAARLDGQTALLHHLKVFSARDQHRIFAGARQKCADRRTNAACANDHISKLHCFFLLLKPVEKLRFSDNQCSDYAEHESSESSHAETFSLLKYENRGTRPRFSYRHFVPAVLMRAAARLLFSRENRLYQRTERTMQDCPLSLYSSASSRTADTAASASSSVLKKEKLNRTAPCCTVPSASCMRGAQCAPARVAMP